jgi:hypothetical protein
MSELGAENGESFIARLNAGKRELGRLLAQKIPTSATSPLQQPLRNQLSNTRQLTAEVDIEPDMKRTRSSLYSSNISDTQRYTILFFCLVYKTVLPLGAECWQI